MRGQFSIFTFILLFFVLLDAYAFLGYQSVFEAGNGKWIAISIYAVISLVGYLGLYKSLTLWRTTPLTRPFYVNLLSGFAFVLLVSKFVFILLLMTQDFGRILFGFVHQLKLWIQPDASVINIMPDRIVLLTSLSLGIAAIPFASMIYGVIRGKYRYTVENLRLEFSNLPNAFDGFRIVQISDIHSGSWDDKKSVAKGIEMIRDQRADMIVFTGDLVNRDKDEINPFMDLFKSLTAPFGKYAILGNHDYYGQPLDKSQRDVYWNDYFEKYKYMGFDLLLNENRSIQHGEGSIRLVGIENWGSGRWFPKRGDLDLALKDVAEEEFCVLLSHDPTHWDAKVLPHSRHIDLTLSGHTHGMQFGINWGKIKWSPVQYRYKQWMGLYEKLGQKLYINRGFGFLAFPGRVGMWPEITVIELKKCKPNVNSFRRQIKFC